MTGLKWSDADEIGFRLSEKLLGTDPFSVRFAELRDWVLALEDFDDEPTGSNEKLLEAIQMAWAEYLRERN